MVAVEVVAVEVAVEVVVVVMVEVVAGKEEAAAAAVGHGSIWNACLKKTGLSRNRLSPIYNNDRRPTSTVLLSATYYSSPFEQVITIYR